MAITGGARIPAQMFQHAVSVETYAGSNATGPTYARKVTVSCLLVDRRRMTRDSDGTEQVSETTLYCPPGSVEFTPESRVTTADGDTTTVISSRAYSAGGLPLPECVEVLLR